MLLDWRVLTLRTSLHRLVEMMFVDQYLSILGLLVLGSALRRRVLRRLGDAGPAQAPDRRETRALRVRDRARDRPAATLSGPLLPRGDDLRDLRHRGRLHVPLRRRVPPARGLRTRRGARLLGRGLQRAAVSGSRGGAHLGSGQAPRAGACPRARADSTIVRIGADPDQAA